LFIPVFTGKIN